MRVAGKGVFMSSLSFKSQLALLGMDLFASNKHQD